MFGKDDNFNFLIILFGERSNSKNILIIKFN